MESKLCNECNIEFTNNNPNVIYCKTCYDIRKRDVYELIDQSGHCRIFTKENMNEFANHVNKEIQVRLDYNGVLDTLPRDEHLKNPQNICCISFVGSTTNTRVMTREDIIKRLGHQINFGVLVFLRGNSKNKNRFHTIGGKAHVNSVIPIGLNKKAIFIDDSEDHCLSVSNLNIENLDSILLTEDVDLRSLIDYYNQD